VVRSHDQGTLRRQSATKNTCDKKTGGGTARGIDREEAMFLRSTRAFRAASHVISVSFLATFALLTSIDRPSAQAPAIYAAGDTIVSAFSGVLQSPPPYPSGNPIDETFINLDGPSMQIQRPQPAGPPSGQLIASPTLYTARARDVGQVFAVTLDDWPTPNIFLAATSSYGLQIVAPDSDGDGRPERVTTGQPGAQWMQGQWGPGGTAGSIWRVDATTGLVSLFTTIGANSGPGLGDIVYDRGSRQFFVSDLDTGLIYRLDWTGFIVDTFDHGVAARPNMGLPPIPDDNAFMDIQNPAFDALNPATWGYTQPERRVRGMAAYGGRLFYTAATGQTGLPQVWSVGIRLDGTFAPDARWELDVTGYASNNEVADMLFDGQGRMILAQRGQQRGSYDYSIFADPLLSSVLRYRREIPDNPATPGTWVPVPEEYAIGFRPEGRNTTGGVALGYNYRQNGQLRSGACNEFLWTTGESLRDNPLLAAQLAAGGPATVHGLQGNDRNLVRPYNDPPWQSYFTDYDGQFIDPAYQGHMGDVEIWQPCQGGTSTYYPPYFPPPGYTPPPPSTFNLTLSKAATPYDCVPGGIGYVCQYTVRVTNTGASWYWGPITVEDWLVGNPPGAVVHLGPQPPWVCAATGPATYSCAYPPVFLWPGESVDLYVIVELPLPTDLCYLHNVASLTWWPGYGDANSGDDWGFATAKVPNPDCAPPTGETTNLIIDKTPFRMDGDFCADDGAGNWICAWLVTVTNAGLGVYSGSIVVTDTLSVSNNVVWEPDPPWTCTNPGPSHTCTLPAGSLPDGGGTQLNPGNSVAFAIGVFIPKAQLVEAGQCWVYNQAKITDAPGGSPLNTDPNDDESVQVELKVRGENCEPSEVPETDLSILKEPHECFIYEGPDDGIRRVELSEEPLVVEGPDLPRPEPGDIVCVWKVTITNESPVNDFSGDLSIGDTPTPLSTVNGLPFCVDDGAGGLICTAPASIGAGETVGPVPFWQIIPNDGSVCEVANKVRILQPPGGLPQNTDPTNDESEASQPVPSPFCDDEPVPQKIITCPVEQRTPDGGCCPPGERWTGRACSGGEQPPPPPPPPPDACPPGLVGTPPNCSCPTNMVWNGQMCVPPTVEQCPQGTTGTFPNCQCLPPLQGTWPNCQPPPTQQCPQGTTGNYPDCRCLPPLQGTWPNCKPPPTQQCPQGSTGTFPNCQCLPPLQGTWPNCKPPTQQCPQGTTGNYPDCRCLPPLQGTWPNCKPPTTQQCPQGTTGNYPDCRCQPPLQGTWPNCQQPPTQQQCPPGSVGNFPDCRCQPGMAGIFPLCFQVPTEPTPTACPPDSNPAGTGCRCKPGSHGTPGKCQPNETGPSGPNIQGGGTLTVPPQILVPNLQLLPRQGTQQQQQQKQTGPSQPQPGQCPAGTIGIFPLCIPQ
jgi:hypothetical protein